MSRAEVKLNRPAPSATIFDKSRLNLSEKSNLRKDAEKLLANPEFRIVQVTEIRGVPGIKWDTTVTIGRMPSLGGWRIAPAEHLIDTYDKAKAANPEYTNSLTDKSDIGNSKEAKAGVVEAERLATDMALKWAIMRASMKYARDHQMDVYPEGVTKEMVESWIEASKLSGGKSVAVNERPNAEKIIEDDRRKLIYQHANHINKLNTEIMDEGNEHITAPDMGTTTPDMTALRFFTPNVASMAPEHGGSGNPSPVTAFGVFYGTKSMLEFMGKDGNNTTFAIQGAAGEVGSHLVQHLKEEYPDAKIVIAEAENPEAQEKAQKLASMYTNVGIVNGEEIFQQQGSIFVPSGPSAQLNDAHLEMMKNAEVIGVIGPANYLYPPYQEAEMSQKYHDAGILVAPAPLVNQGGIFKIALGELLQGDKPSEEIINKSIAHVGPMLTYVFEQAKAENKTPEEIFREIALDEFAELCVEYGILK